MKKITISLTFLLFIFKGYSQTCTDVKELLRKRHTISGMTYGHPYTMFNRHPSTTTRLPGQRGSITTYTNFSLDSAIANIRKRILFDKSISNVEILRGPMYQAYKLIYTNATNPRPTDDGTKNGTDKSALAIWAKNNAFVFLIGVDGNGKLI